MESAVEPMRIHAAYGDFKEYSDAPLLQIGEGAIIIARQPVARNAVWR